MQSYWRFKKINGTNSIDIYFVLGRGGSSDESGRSTGHNRVWPAYRPVKTVVGRPIPLLSCLGIGCHDEHKEA
jgi:hypothetical protein